MTEYSPISAPAASPVIVWFRYDLRLQDQAALAAALETLAPVIPVFILSEDGTRPLGSASRWWLDRSLRSLDQDLRKRGSRLVLAMGLPSIILPSLCKELSVKTVYCSHTFDPQLEETDQALGEDLQHMGIRLERFNTTLLTRPNQLHTQSDQPFRVFTPYYKALNASGLADIRRLPGHIPELWPAPETWPESLTIDDLKLVPALTPSGHDWSAGFTRFFPGEPGARKALRGFLRQGLVDYALGRDRPDRDVTSHLSPHLRFGEISPQRILLETDKVVADNPTLSASAAKFRSELAWREFSYGLLHQQPRLHDTNFRRDFDRFPWRDDEAAFKAWCRGETGYPLVDAGMRELWQTGYMHNRVRMVAASFLVKHLLIDWRRGEEWFWDCLLDADPASNPASWQWVAGCGADAAPYFRVFNPTTQAEKFDSDSAYRRKYIQGYTTATGQILHMQKMPELFDSKSKSGTLSTYPQPIIDHNYARDRALEAYKNRAGPEEI
jgi:deoxyribodipyrimidine photo-lyase